MSGKKEQKFELSDKSMDSHREFLDMDTDEEDFGRRESPEVEEELPVEPERPVFSDEDLITLVNHVKDLTVHACCDNMNWDEHCDEIIQEYFTNPSRAVLSIFSDNNKNLSAILDIPTHAANGFTYFLRSQWQVYTAENFRSTVVFGTFNENLRNTILTFIENLYAPIVLHSEEYASFLRNDLLLNLHKFIMQLREEIYKPMGLTVLYVPKERVLQSFSKRWNRKDYLMLGGNRTTALSEEEERKRKLIQRLEHAVWYWIKQIREATKTVRRMDIKNIQDEVNCATAKKSNLSYLRKQLLNPEVRAIIDILRNTNSLPIMKLEKLIVDVNAGLKETSSNLMYLNILLDVCKNLVIAENMESSMTEALLLIIYIWTESPFYSISRNMEILCRTFSSQIMCRCIEYIRLDVIFEKNPEDGIRMLKKCILACNIYEKLYDNLTTKLLSHIGSEKKWDINRQEVFDEIDSFRQRCYDVIEICKAIIVFGRNNKTGLIGGPKGADYEAYWRYIESLFYECLNDITTEPEIIFDVTKFIWRKKIERFKHAMLELENMVVNLVNDIFENVRNVEEGVEAIYALQILKKREKFREMLHGKWIQVWRLFNHEIEDCYTNAIIKWNEHADTNEHLSNVVQYLQYQHSIMINASVWIDECGVEKYTLEQYEYVLDVIDKRRKMFNTYNTNGTH